MMTGTVSRRRAILELLVRGLSGPIATVEFVLDTGFTGTITPPPAACAALALPFLRLQPAGLADRRRAMLRVYECTLVWDGVDRLVEVLAAEGAPLIGMTLLDGADIHLHVTEGGRVTITPF